MKKYTGAQIIWETLVKEGVDTVYGYPGGGVIPIYDTMLDYPAVHHVLSRHEQGAVHMADGYARATGKTGVAFGTSGPGVTNMVTGIATAMLDSTPIVCITGQTPVHLLGYDAFQEVDTTGITMPITKHNYLVTDVKDLGQVLKEAFHIANSGRPGPVLVDIPKNVQNGSTEWDYDSIEISLPGYKQTPDVKTEDLEQFALMLKAAHRPLILAGQGVIQGRAVEQMFDFALKQEIPVATTLLGIGAFPAGHPLYLGMPGMHGEAWVNNAIQEADLLLAFGMRFDDRVTGKTEDFAPSARKIHVDIDPSELNKNIKVDLAICGDLRSVLEEADRYLTPVTHTPWIERISKERVSDVEKYESDSENPEQLSARLVVKAINEYTDGKALVVTDVGQQQMWAAQYYKSDHPKNMISSGGLGTMGFGLPAAIGAKMARPEADVWLFVGDGGFQMTQAELATITQENIKVNIAIINNGYLGMVRQWQELFYDKRYAATPMISPDFVKIAEAHGHTGIRVTRFDEIKEAVKTAQKNDGTTLIEFVVIPEENVYPMVPAGAKIDDMLRRPDEELS